MITAITTSLKKFDAWCMWRVAGFWLIGLIGGLFWAPGQVFSAAWMLGTPIVTYYPGVGHGTQPLTDAIAQQAVNGGYNVVWAFSPAELDVAQRYGLRAMYGGDFRNDTVINQIRNHPALYSYYIKDEPSTSEFSSLAYHVARLRALDPSHVAYINLHPSYARTDALGASDYPSYLNQYMSYVQPSLLSYDHYQLKTSGDSPEYFKNLAIISKTAKEYGVPFMNTVQACAWESSWRVPTEGELRFLANTSLAYGAQGISYWAYNTQRANSGGLAPNPDGSPTSVYTALQSVNPKFVAIAEELQTMQHIGAYHLGDLPPGYGTTDGSSPLRLPSDSPFNLSPSIADSNYRTNRPVRGAVLGLFGSDDKVANAEAAYVVNLNYSGSLMTTVTGTGDLSIYDTAIGRWIDQHQSSVNIILQAGDGALVRLTSVVPEPTSVALLSFSLICVTFYHWRRH